MKVYVIMKGEYSDKEIIGVVSTEEKAKQAVIANTDVWGTPYYFEYELDEVVMEYHSSNIMHAITFSDDGSIKNIKAFYVHEPDKMLNGVYDFDKWGEIDAFMFFERLSNNVSLFDTCKYIVAEPDEAKAIKLASEQRAMYIARQKGLC